MTASDVTSSKLLQHATRALFAKHNKTPADFFTTKKHNCAKPTQQQSAHRTLVNVNTITAIISFIMALLAFGFVLLLSFHLGMTFPEMEIFYDEQLDTNRINLLLLSLSCTLLFGFFLELMVMHKLPPLDLGLRHSTTMLLVFAAALGYIGGTFCISVAQPLGHYAYTHTDALGTATRDFTGMILDRNHMLILWILFGSFVLCMQKYMAGIWAQIGAQLGSFLRLGLHAVGAPAAAGSLGTPNATPIGLPPPAPSAIPPPQPAPITSTPTNNTPSQNTSGANSPTQGDLSGSSGIPPSTTSTLGSHPSAAGSNSSATCVPDPCPRSTTTGDLSPLRRDRFPSPKQTSIGISRRHVEETADRVAALSGDIERMTKVIPADTSSDNVQPDAVQAALQTPSDAKLARNSHTGVRTTSKGMPKAQWHNSNHPLAMKGRWIEETDRLSAVELDLFNYEIVAPIPLLTNGGNAITLAGDTSARNILAYLSSRGQADSPLFGESMEALGVRRVRKIGGRRRRDSNVSSKSPRAVVMKRIFITSSTKVYLRSVAMPSPTATAPVTKSISSRSNASAGCTPNTVSKSVVKRSRSTLASPSATSVRSFSGDDLTVHFACQREHIPVS